MIISSAKLMWPVATRAAAAKMAAARTTFAQSHHRAPLEPIRERAGGQGQKQPREAVCGDDGGDGQRIRIDDDRQKRHRTIRRARLRNWQR